MTYITDQSQIADAETSTLIATYNWLTGKSIARFSSRGAGERQVANALLQAFDRAAHKGVPKGQKPNVADGALGAPGAQKPAPAPAPDAPRKPSAIAQVAAALKGKNTPVKTPKKTRAVARSGVTAVRFTGAGTSKPHEGSKRNAVLQFIAAQPKKTATLETIEAHFKHSCRGFVQKLIEVKHLEVVA